MRIKEYYRLKNITLPQNNDINIIDLIRLLYEYSGNSHKLNNKTEKLKEYIQNKGSSESLGRTLIMRTGFIPVFIIVQIM